MLTAVRAEFYHKEKLDGTASAQNLLVAAGVTRFGVLAIAVYLVQILVHLYRYNMRLASFYRGQADALVLIDYSPKQLGALVAKISPNLDFGKTARTIPQELLASVKQTVESAVARAKGKKAKEEEQED